jgi:hypothetical protein
MIDKGPGILKLLLVDAAQVAGGGIVGDADVPGVGGGQLVHDRAGAVGGAVVEEQQLVVAEPVAHGGHRLAHRVRDVRLLVERRDDEGDGGLARGRRH